MTPPLLPLLALALAQDLPPAAPAAAPVETTVAPDAVEDRGTVVFIHGLYVNSRCWDGWKQRFEAAGYTVLTPDWPVHAGDPAALRASPPEGLRALGLEDVVDHFREIVKSSATPPILIGHSMGGLIVQILLSEGLGQAGVAIDSAPPKGVFSFAPSFARSNSASLTPGKRPVLLAPRKFHYAFANNLSKEASAGFYQALVVPESRLATRGPLTAAGEVDFDAKHAPLLMLAGGNDHITPAGMNKKNAEKYDPAAGRVDFEVLDGRSHLTLGEPGWEAVADRVLGWLGALG